MTFIRHAISAGFMVILASTASGQTAPTPEEILGAWLSSPHAQADSEPFRHWDSDSEIPGDCAVCHSTTGVVDYLADPSVGVGRIGHPVPTGTTVECAACHNPNAETLSDVTFPSGEVATLTRGSAICSVCHQGRASGDAVTAALDGRPEDQVSGDIGFINIHYSAAGTTRLGGTVRGGYEYAGQIYAGAFAHVDGLGTCVSCHGAHDTTVQISTCTSCHQGAADFRAIRTTPTDILGNGDVTTGIAVVIDDLHDRLGAAIMTYAADVGGGAIIYSADAYPYFFNDLNANGTVDEDEAGFMNRYQSWTPRLLRAAYNYQFIAKDHGAFAHNPHYAIQVLFDSITDLATVARVDVAGLVRP